jgi:hypothetical protein
LEELMADDSLAARLKAAIARRSPDDLHPSAAKLWTTVARWKESKANPPPPPEAVWCLVANVAEFQVHGEDHEVRRGTKHFSPNTKVYCFPSLWSDAYENVQVIGRHRGSSRLIVLIMPRKRLTNWRVKLVRHPYVVAKLGNYWTEAYAHEVAAYVQFEEAADASKRQGFELVAADDALLYASRFGLVDEIERALERGADIAVRRGEYSPLSLAITRRHKDAVRYLLEHGADPAAPCGSYPSARAMAQTYWKSSPDEVQAIFGPGAQTGKASDDAARFGRTWRFGWLRRLRRWMGDG